MATLSDLMTAVATATGIPETTVFAYGRFAREKGYIAQRGHGRAAASMTPADAANLLIAIGGTGVTRDAGKATEQFRPMRGHIIDDRSEFRDSFREWQRPLGLGSGQKNVPPSFGNYLEFLVHEAATGGMARFLRTIPVSTETIRSGAPIAVIEGITLFEGTPQPKVPSQVQLGEDVQVSIKFIRTQPGIVIEFRRHWNDVQNLHVVEFSPLQSHTGPYHFRVTAEVTLNTITALGLALSGIRIPKTLRSPEDFSRFFASHELGSL